MSCLEVPGSMSQAMLLGPWSPTGSKEDGQTVGQTKPRSGFWVKELLEAGK